MAKLKEYAIITTTTEYHIRAASAFDAVRRVLVLEVVDEVDIESIRVLPPLTRKIEWPSGERGTT